MKIKNTFIVFCFAVLLNGCEKEDVGPAQIGALDCSGVTFSGDAANGVSFTATATIPYSGGNGGEYGEGDAVASSGVSGLTATLSAGRLSEGSGTAVYIITGTPSSVGTASFDVTFGGQRCTLVLPVAASAASVSALTLESGPAGATESVSYAASLAVAYTGGNGAEYSGSSVMSTGVEGLTATLAAGQLANGAGTLTYTVSGTPASAGTATFNFGFGGKTLTVTVVVEAAVSGTATDTVKIAYAGAGATVSNAYANDGVSISVSGANVTVTSTNTAKEMVYLLSGTSTNGTFKVYSEYKFVIAMNNLTLTHTAGPAINIQSGKKATLHLPAGTSSTLADGATYASSNEDQKGTVFSEGQLVFTGTGALTVTSNNRHAIVSDDYISVSQARITVKGAEKDGIHANDYFTMDSGTLSVTSAGDGIDVEEGYILIKGGDLTVTTSGEKSHALKSEGYTTIGTAGTLALTVSGKGSKAIKTTGHFTLNSGTLKLTTSGSAFYDTSDADISAPAGINCDGDLTINGGSLTITSTGAGAKGITVDGTATLNGGNTNITASGAKFTYSSSKSSESKGFKSDGAFIMTNGELTISAADDGLKSETSIMVTNGNINITKSTEGVEAPLITFAGGVTNIVSSNDGINATKGTVSGGTESNDGSHLYIKGGIVIVAGSDAIDSNGNVTISGGTTIVSGDGREEGIDVNGNFLINGGNVIIAGPSNNMTKAMGSASTQVSLYLKSRSQLSTSSLLHIENASGMEMVTFKPKSTAYYFHFSNPSMAKNTEYKIYFGGSYSGGGFVGNSSGWGMYTGGTYSSSGANVVTTLTTSSSATVNTVSF